MYNPDSPYHNLGYLLTSENIDIVNKTILKDRDQWLEKNPQLIEEAIGKSI